MKKNLKSHKKGAATAVLISSLAYIVLGVIMLIFPDKVSNFLCYALGFSLTVYGLFNIISFFLSREAELYLELVIGIIATAFGIFTIVSPQTIKSIIFIAIGVVIIIDSCMDVKKAVQLKAFGMKKWWVCLAASAAIVLLGAATIIFPTFFGDFLIVLLGILLIYEGVSGLVIMGLIAHFVKLTDKNKKMIDTTASDTEL